MYSTKIAAGAMIVRTIRRPGNGCLGVCFNSVSSPPPKGGSDGIGEKAKQTMDDVMGAAKDTSQKLKERVMGSGNNDTAKPSQNPDLNHGVESTDSSCEDVRDRPGGYS